MLSQRNTSQKIFFPYKNHGSEEPSAVDVYNSQIHSCFVNVNVVPNVYQFSINVDKEPMLQSFSRSILYLFFEGLQIKWPMSSFYSKIQNIQNRIFHLLVPLS